MSTATRGWRVSEWPPDAEPTNIELDQVATAEHPCWFEFIVSADSKALDRSSVPVEILSSCEGLSETPGLLDYLLDREHVLDYRRFGPGGKIRVLTALAVIAPPSPSAGDQRLLFDPVKIVASDEWLISAWHESGTSDEPRLRRREEIRRRRRHDRAQQWVTTKAIDRTGGDVAVIALRELALLWPFPLRVLREWRRDWELGFLRRAQNEPSSDRSLDDIARLAELTEQANEFSGYIEYLNVPRQAAPVEWFYGVRDAAKAIDTSALIDEVSRDLADLNSHLRSCFTLLQSYNTVAQLRLAEEQRAITERARTAAEEETRRFDQFQKVVELAVAVLVVPTLIAAVFGANVKLPSTSHWVGLVVLIGAMGLSAAAGIVCCVWLWRRRR